MSAHLGLSSLSTLLALAIGCSAPAPVTQHRAGPAADEPGASDDPATAPASSKDGPRVEGPVGIVVIDVQQVFFDTATRRSPQSDVPARMARSAQLFESAARSHVPFFITFEASKSGDHALPPSLSAALPPQAMQLVKTTFAATGQAQLLPALKASGAKRIVVIGAETDVCVLQSILGLRRAGYEVIAVPDALFTEEVNIGPAVRRMRQAGVVELGMNEAEALVTSGGHSPAPVATKLPVIVRPLELGIVLHDLDGLGAADPNGAAKKARLRELLLISEWFERPVLATDPAKALAALPADLKSILTRPIVALASRPAAVTQLAVAGGHAGIAAAVATMSQGAEIFLLEDVLVGGGAIDLEPLYVAGAVPSTYKTLYYELTQSVDDAGWPSQKWVQNGAKYFDLTKAPEELPPLVP